MRPQAYDEYGCPGKWLTLKNGEHIFIRKGETFDSALLRRRLTRLTCGIPRHVDGFSPAVQIRSKMTPEEKIASVHIDFDKDNVLPELNEKALQQIGTHSKPVLLKKSILERNSVMHNDLSKEDITQILAHALYDEDTEIFPANKTKPYFNFVAEIEVTSKGKPEKGVVMIDVDVKKDCFEIVHIHYVRERSYLLLKKKTQ